jgi:prepilin-type N-terminal cleavage/methylation domain-containing protein
MTRHTISRHARFTLIEVIAVLVLVAILGSVASLGLIAGTEGFVRGRTRIDLVQKSQIAMQRIILELRFPARDESNLPLISVQDSGSTVVFTSRRDGEEHTLIHSGASLLLDGKLLMDRVTAFAVSYNSTSGQLSITLDVEDIGPLQTVIYP